MIDNANKLILVHLPKTGGTSGARVLGARRLRFGGKHRTLQDYKRRIPNFDCYHTFGFVRNPWARMAAWYRYIKVNQPNMNIQFRDWILKPRRFAQIPVREESFFFSDGKFALDSVGKFETLEQDFKRIVAPFLGEIKFPHLNNLGADREYVNHYDQELIQAVAKRHRWVINKFGYRFDQLLATS